MAYYRDRFAFYFYFYRRIKIPPYESYVHLSLTVLGLNKNSNILKHFFGAFDMHVARCWKLDPADCKLDRVIRCTVITVSTRRYKFGKSAVFINYSC
jgi:hypothetical protein